MTAPPTGDALIGAEDSRRMFDRIARRYDRANRLLSLGLDGRWRRSAVSALAPRPHGRYLDVGCGTGDIALEILRQCPDADVVGIDPSEQMLALAAEKARRARRAEKVSFQIGDATTMALPADSFAGVACAFCYRNLTDRAAALAQMRRATSTGGRVVLLELTVPSRPLLRLGHRAYNRWLVPLAGRVLTGSGGAYHYLADSIRDLPPPPEICEQMTAAGFDEVVHRPLSGGVVGLFVGHRLS